MFWVSVLIPQPIQNHTKRSFSSV